MLRAITAFLNDLLLTLHYAKNAKFYHQRLLRANESLVKADDFFWGLYREGKVEGGEHLSSLSQARLALNGHVRDTVLELSF